MAHRKLRYRLAASSAAVLAAAAVGACGSSNSSSGGKTVAAASGVSSKCKPAHHFTNIQQGKLLVDYLVEPPWMDADGSKLTGINGPLITEFAKMECLTLVPHLAQAATELTDVIQHRVDVGDGGWYSTPQRAKVVGQTIPLYYDGWGIVSKGGKYSSISQLMGKPVATISGELMTPILQKVLGSDAMLFDNASDALQAVTTGRAVAWLAGGSEAAYRVNKAGKASGLGFQFLKPTTQLPPSLTPSAVNWPHTKDNAGMTAAMNADIRTMRTNGTVMRALKAYGMQQFFNPPKQ